MKPITVFGAVLVVSTILTGCASGTYSQRREDLKPGGATIGLITNRDIIALSRAGLSDSVIVTLINIRGSDFHLNTSDVIALADSGVSDNVITAMIQAGRSAQAEDYSGGYITYPPYPWYAYDPFWLPYYSGVWLGFSSWPHRQWFVHHSVAPYHRFSGGVYGGHRFGGYRPGGRRR